LTGGPLSTRSPPRHCEELTGIDSGLRDAAKGRFATDDEIEAVFAKHRRPWRSSGPGGRLPIWIRFFPTPRSITRRRSHHLRNASPSFWQCYEKLPAPVRELAAVRPL